VTRWLDETGGTRGPEYAERFARLAAEGAAMHGEADCVASLIEGTSVLDAGCGIGRVAIELARRGFDVVGVDNDASMLDEARRSQPELAWHDADLVDLDLGRTFDLVVCAGNVVVYLTPGTGRAVLARLAAHLRPGGLLVSGWRTDRLTPEDYDAWARPAGLTPVERRDTWDGSLGDGSWCVAVHRLRAAAPA
jgi:2-polyprenyl-3-methyl-5-hydroxy-6-metoxy-1,4-benzoquinol methylase